MNKRIFLSLIAVTLLLNSCKEDKQSQQHKEINDLEQISDSVIEKDVFSFNIDAEFLYDDEIYFYYLTPETDKITTKNSLQKNVFGSTELQTLSFNLPEEVLPTRVFLRFGDNKKQKIIVKNINLSYGKNVINIPDSLFFQYFNPNRSIIFNKEDYSLNISTKNNQNPMFFSRKTLEDKVDNEFFLKNN